MTVKRIQGFTLIELLIVVAILGILGAILFVAIGTSPQISARDARRISDVNQLQLALELYKNAGGAYPAALTGLVPTYIGGVPKDPKTSLSYEYFPSTDASMYHLLTTLESDVNKALCSDADFNSATDSSWTAGTNGGGGNTALNCGTATNGDAASPGAKYDVKS